MALTTETKYEVCASLEVPDDVMLAHGRTFPTRHEEMFYTREEVITFVDSYVKEFVGASRLTLSIRRVGRPERAVK
jgi:hypothetical protein